MELCSGFNLDIIMVCMLVLKENMSDVVVLMGDIIIVLMFVKEEIEC